MPGPKPLVLTVSDRQLAILQGLVRRQTTPQRLVYRAKVILAAAEGNSNDAISPQLGRNRNTVRTWRQRWHTTIADWAEAEMAGAEDKVLVARIKAALDDAPRPGTPGAFSAAQVT